MCERLHLAAEGKAAKTIRLYTEAVTWFAATRLADKPGWEQVSRRDIQEWMAWLLGRYSEAYASNQYRALRQFFKWLAALQMAGRGGGPARPDGRTAPTEVWAITLFGSGDDHVTCAGRRVVGEGGKRPARMTGVHVTRY